MNFITEMSIMLKNSLIELPNNKSISKKSINKICKLIQECLV